MRVQAAKCVNDTFCRLTGFCQHHTNPLCSFNQLHHQRRTTDQRNQISGVIRRISKTGRRQINAFTRQNLHGTQFIARPGDRHRFIQRETAQHFKLTQHRCAIEGNRGANSWDHRMVLIQLMPAIVHAGRSRIDIHVAGQWIDNVDLMSACFSRFLQAFTRIQRPVTGKNCNFHPTLRRRLACCPTLLVQCVQHKRTLFLFKGTNNQITPGIASRIAVALQIIRR
ncbi:hypothetical protein SRABI106_03891 [Rahnella aquatilis]|nr:hypothetical protein SRABI106_03891 [Rahnella aquatilis]